MSDKPEPLPPDLDAFLAPERQRPDPPAAVRDEVLSRIGTSLGWPPGGAPPSGAAGAGAKHLATASVLKTVATLVVGGVIGSGIHAAYDRAADRRVAPAPVVAAAPTPPPPPAPAPTPVAPPAPAAAPSPSPSPRPEHVTRERDRNLAAERALIEQARTALAREQGAAALAALERHARDFPQGELEEERESLLVQALVALERSEQARKVAARFHRRFPRSIFGAVVDEALRSIP